MNSHAAARPAALDSRRRRNSIVPAVPAMPNIHTHNYPQPHTPPMPTIPIPSPHASPLQQQQQPVQHLTLQPGQHRAYQSPQQTVSQPLQQAEHVPRTYFKPPLPWYSAPDEPFPERLRRRRKPSPPPARPSDDSSVSRQSKEPSTAASVSERGTPPTTNPPSEIDSTHPTTPSSMVPSSHAAIVPSKPTPALPTTPPAVPIAIPVISPKAKATKASKDDERRQSVSTNSETASATSTAHKLTPATPNTEETAAPQPQTEPVQRVDTEPLATPAPVHPPTPALAPAKPTLWADLLKSKSEQAVVTRKAVTKTNGFANGLYNTLEEALIAFQIDGGFIRTPFLEPRGLINTGNMCFMNAILQMLVSCGPFYYFLDRVSTSAKSFKDNTPLIETMIMFMREFRVVSPDSKVAIRSEDMEALGAPFAPEFVYEAIRKLKRFSHMRHGHQQDAEEFLGFLLDGLHEEAVEAMKKTDSAAASKINGHSADEKGGWMEVGHKQKAATTRTTEIQESPITKIFGGKLRSVFSVPGLTKSVTLEPYTPLQLDIQAPEVKSVVDALKHLTTPEKINGDFKSPKGPGVTATKQVFIETLPPVLILHLKRFQYDNTGGTQKIWKKIAYPLQLEIPPEAMSRRPPQSAKYRLIGVVYHHGSSAQGGHYTVDVLRQDAKSWIRLDDTAIQTVSPKEVAVDVHDIGKYNDLDGEEQDGWVNVWEQVNANGGSANGQNRKGEGKRYVGKDSRVAYILFYQKW